MCHQIFRASILISFLVLFAFYIAGPISLSGEDMGRHIKNGELILSGQKDVLYKNYYSYTYPQYPFINHHWLAGVIFYIVVLVGGFQGLSALYVLLMLMTFLLFFDAARRISNFSLAMFLSVAVFLVIVDRKECRPDVFSFFFMGLYFYLFSLFQQRKINTRLLFWIILLAQIFWVNIHIFFFMGPVLTAFFLWQTKAIGDEHRQVGVLQKLLVAVILVNLINPSGLWGMFTPFNIFKVFSIPVVECQPVFTMMQKFPWRIVYKAYFVIAAIAGMGAVFALCRNGARRHLPMIVLMGGFLAAGFAAVRLMLPAGLFFIPLVASFIASLNITRIYAIPWFHRVIMIVTVMGLIIYAVLAPKDLTIGLPAHINDSADFFKKSGLKGPIFNDFDIGSYLDYHLAGKEKVFVDNRPEAYPPEFFKNVYIPMQVNDKAWHQTQARYGFNIIYFNYHEITSWSQRFLVDRFADPQWAPVFIDNYAVILARRGSINDEAIKRFELSRDRFGFITLPGAGQGIGFDDMYFSPILGKVIVPGAGTGQLFFIDYNTRKVESMNGFSKREGYQGGHGDGITSVAEGQGFLFVTDHTTKIIDVVDPARRTVVASATLAGSPDYVRYVDAVKEVWVTQPKDQRIEVFSFSGDGNPALVHRTFIPIPGGPESLVIDNTRQQAYTHLWAGETIVINIKAHEVVAQWPNGCQGSRGMALDESDGFLFAGCKEGRATVLDLQNGRVLGNLLTGLGVDIIAYNPFLRHLYIPASKSGFMTIIKVSLKGELSRLDRVQIALGSHCVVSDNLDQVWVCDPHGGQILLIKDRS